MTQDDERFARLVEVIGLAYDHESGVFALTRWQAAYVAGLAESPGVPVGTQVKAASYVAYADTVFVGANWEQLLADARAGKFDAALFQRGALYARNRE